MTTIPRALQHYNIFYLYRTGIITREEFLKAHAELNKQERVVG